jgi:arsenite-transporting ATPase
MQVPHMGGEVFGMDLLDEIGDGLYAERAPTDVYHEEPTYRVRESGTGTGYVVDVRLPFAEDADVTTRHFGDQLVVQVGNQRRNHVLPKFLSYYTLTGSHVADGWLHASFEK